MKLADAVEDTPGIEYRVWIHISLSIYRYYLISAV